MTRARILLVEDMVVTALGMSQKLKRMGYDVVGPAASGEKAVELAESNRPDVVLMDINLKGMDGIEAAGRIIEKCDIPVIFTTAYTDPGTTERAKSVNAVGFLAKPYEDDLLAATIKDALSKVPSPNR